MRMILTWLGLKVWFRFWVQWRTSNPEIIIHQKQISLLTPRSFKPYKKLRWALAQVCKLFLRSLFKNLMFPKPTLFWQWNEFFLRLLYDCTRSFSTVRCTLLTRNDCFRVGFKHLWSELHFFVTAEAIIKIDSSLQSNCVISNQ